MLNVRFLENLQESKLFLSSDANIKKLPKEFRKVFKNKRGLTFVNRAYQDGKNRSMYILVEKEDRPKILVAAGYDFFFGENCSGIKVFGESRLSNTEPVLLFHRSYRLEETSKIPDIMMKIAKASNPIEMCKKLNMNTGHELNGWRIDWEW